MVNILHREPPKGIAYPDPQYILSPLAVDLDGTLSQGDTTLLMSRKLLKQEPWRVFQFFFWILRGRAFLKRQLSQVCAFEANDLVYDRYLLGWLQSLKETGISLILITGSNQSVADAVAAHVGLFDQAIGSDGVINRTGIHKVQWLDAHYGRGHYGYLGNSKTDLPVWGAAGQALAINLSPSVWKRLQHLKPDALRLPPTLLERALDK